MKSLFVKFKEKLIPSFKPQEHEQLVIDIIGLLFDDEDTECITAPISGKYYISNKRLGYYVKVGDTSVTITNHKFTYVAQSPLPFNDYVINVVRNYIEKDREEFEKKVFHNELQLLQNIKSSIKTI
jgi:hypothetical protein